MRPLLLALGLLAACGGEPDRPNVLVVTIDTLRPDALGPGTPAIQAFFREATRYPRARTVVPLTLPSHTSMFTGLFPMRHGIHDNVTEPLPPAEQRAFPLLAEQFRDAGYATAAFVSRAVLARQTGIAGGFDVFECPVWEEQQAEVVGEDRIKGAIAWMKGARRGKPWFLWVHFFDPHAPYLPYPGDGVRAPSRPEDPDRLLYEGEVRCTDAAFEKLLREVPRDTIVVVCSDHGEGLYAHGESTHGPLCYSSTIDAVLAVRAPGFTRGAVDSGLRSVADVTPTLRALCGLPALSADGLDLKGPGHETLVAESLLTWSTHGWGQCFAVTDGLFTLVESGPRLELFDRREDPGETLPLALDHPAYEKLDRALEAFRGGPVATGEGDLFPSVSPYGELRLRGIRYLSRADNARLLDPVKHLKSWAMLAAIPPLVRLCLERRDAAPLENALRVVDDIERKSPGTPRIDHSRAEIHAAYGEITGDPAHYVEAARAELKAIEKGYVQAETILPAISYCLKASEAEVFRALLERLKTQRLRLNDEIERALADAAAQLGVSAEGFPPR
jgi:arylsulfatase A-like enzyme